MTEALHGEASSNAPPDEYREAWDDWNAQLTLLHAVFLDGQPLEPPKMKGLLNREARAKERYDRARLRLLGLEAD